MTVAMLAQAPLGCTCLGCALGGVPLLAANLARGADWFCVAELMTASGGATGSGRDRLQAALAGGDSGASQPAMQELVDAIIELGHLPSQSRSSSAEEKRLAVRLIKARKAGTLIWQQEAQLGNLKPATTAVVQTPSGLYRFSSYFDSYSHSYSYF